MTVKGLISVWGLLLLLAGFVPAALAEEPAVPADDSEGDEPAVVPAPTEPKDDKARPFGLYLGVAGGIVSAIP